MPRHAPPGAFLVRFVLGALVGCPREARGRAPFGFLEQTTGQKRKIKSHEHNSKNNHGGSARIDSLHKYICTNQPAIHRCQYNRRRRDSTLLGQPTASLGTNFMMAILLTAQILSSVILEITM